MNEPITEEERSAANLLSEKEIEDLFYEMERQRKKTKEPEVSYKKEIIFAFASLFLLIFLVAAIKLA